MCDLLLIILHYYGVSRGDVQPTQHGRNISSLCYWQVLGISVTIMLQVFVSGDPKQTVPGSLLRR